MHCAALRLTKELSHPIFSITHQLAITHAGWFFFAEPSPEHSNGSGSRRVSAMPVNLTPDGVFEDTEHVMLELRGEGELHYTINGSAPTKDSPLYTEPIEIAATSVVSVKSFEENALPSRLPVPIQSSRNAIKNTSFFFDYTVNDRLLHVRYKAFLSQRMYKFKFTIAAGNHS